MSLEKKLARWQGAGLIDGTTASRIERFERESERPIVLYALGGLGVLTLGIGIVSVVAANWDVIPRATKLSIDLVLGAVLAFALYRSETRGHAWLSDVLAGVYYAFTLASIALLGQVYQLGSPTYQALLTWSVATAPLMGLARGRLLGSVWLAGLLTTHAMSFEALFEHLGWLDALHGSLPVNLAATLTFASFAMYVALPRIPWFLRERPQVSAAWTNLTWTSVLAAGLAVCFVFYEAISPGDRDRLSWGLAASGAITLGLYAVLPKLYACLTSRVRAGLGALLGIPWLVLAAGTTFNRPELPALGAIVQVVLLGVAAFTVLALGSLRTFNALTACIALRVLIMYFEVFGSMLDTGLGMITGGLLTLLLAWLWKRKSPELAAHFGAHEVPHAS